MMNAKQQALYALMENQGFSYGMIQTVMTILGQSKEELDEMLLFIEDEHPTEEQVIRRIAELCE